MGDTEGDLPLKNAQIEKIEQRLKQGDGLVKFERRTVASTTFWTATLSLDCYQLAKASANSKAQAKSAVFKQFYDKCTSIRKQMSQSQAMILKKSSMDSGFYLSLHPKRLSKMIHYFEHFPLNPQKQIEKRSVIFPVQMFYWHQEMEFIPSVGSDLNRYGIPGLSLINETEGDVCIFSEWSVTRMIPVIIGQNPAYSILTLIGSWSPLQFLQYSLLDTTMFHVLDPAIADFDVTPCCHVLSCMEDFGNILVRSNAQHYKVLAHFRLIMLEISTQFPISSWWLNFLLHFREKYRLNFKLCLFGDIEMDDQLSLRRFLAEDVSMPFGNLSIPPLRTLSAETIYLPEIVDYLKTTLHNPPQLEHGKISDYLGSEKDFSNHFYRFSSADSLNETLPFVPIHLMSLVVIEIIHRQEEGQKIIVYLPNEAWQSAFVKLLKRTPPFEMSREKTLLTEDGSLFQEAMAKKDSRHLILVTCHTDWIYFCQSHVDYLIDPCMDDYSIKEGEFRGFRHCLKWSCASQIKARSEALSFCQKNNQPARHLLLITEERYASILNSKVNDHELADWGKMLVWSLSLTPELDPTIIFTTLWNASNTVNHNEALEFALREAQTWEAITKDELELTAFGELYARSPFHYSILKMVLMGLSLGCLDEAITLASLSLVLSRCTCVPEEALFTAPSVDLMPSDHLIFLEKFTKIQEEMQQVFESVSQQVNMSDPQSLENIMTILERVEDIQSDFCKDQDLNVMIVNQVCQQRVDLFKCLVAVGFLPNGIDSNGNVIGIEYGFEKYVTMNALMEEHVPKSSHSLYELLLCTGLFPHLGIMMPDGRILLRSVDHLKWIDDAADHYQFHRSSSCHAIKLDSNKARLFLYGHECARIGWSSIGENLVSPVSFLSCEMESGYDMSVALMVISGCGGYDNLIKKEGGMVNGAREKVVEIHVPTLNDSKQGMTQLWFKGYSNEATHSGPVGVCLKMRKWLHHDINLRLMDWWNEWVCQDTENKSFRTLEVVYRLNEEQLAFRDCFQ